MKTVLAILALGLCLMLVSCSTPVPKDIPSLKVLAEKGDSRAQYNLGVMYRDHPESKTLSHVLKDDVEAAKWFRKSSLQGYAEAQYALGQKYAYGVGKDEKEEAAKWFRKAAEQGDAFAQYFLVEMYADGEGVPEDDMTAYAWWNIAANGFAPAKGVKDLLAKTMTPDQIAAAEALAKEMISKNPKLLKKQLRSILQRIITP